MVANGWSFKPTLLLDLFLLVGLQALVVLYAQENRVSRSDREDELYRRNNYSAATISEETPPEAKVLFNTLSPKDLMLASAVILASASSSCWVRGRSR